MKINKAIFIAATGQNVGKTTVSLGVLSTLTQKYHKVGFMKPIGQEHVEAEKDLHVDKDVLLFKNYFDLKDSFKDMSPVLFPKGFTRDFLDGKVAREELTKKIEEAFQQMASRNEITIVEGTGHTAVGSIVDLNNAQVAALLGIHIIMVAPGGLGSSFDEIALNKAQCEKYGVKIAGVILNRVLPEKKRMIKKYMLKALEAWKIPLLGCIPFNSFLNTPSMEDFAQLFQSPLLSGKEHRFCHFEQIGLITTFEEMGCKLIRPNELIITDASREDILENVLRCPGVSVGMILTGNSPPKTTIVARLKKMKIPMLYAPYDHFLVTKMISSYTTKIRKKDIAKIEEAIRVVRGHIDLDLLYELL